MLVQVKIYYDAPRDKDRIKNLLARALNRLKDKHRFYIAVIYEEIKIFEGRQRVIIKVYSGNDRVFSLTTAFVYWAFEDYTRKHGFEVFYAIQHVKEDLSWVPKGPGEE